MNDLPFPDVLHRVPDVFHRPVLELDKVFRLRTTIRILIVVDGFISLTESPSGFGIGRIVRLLRESTVGCMRFHVDLARRDGSTPATNPNPPANQPRYVGFRFNQQEGGAPILDQYHEVWCFGFNPDNNAGTDANITLASAFPASNAELAVLTRWMNEQRGGLLAMGDHDYLGASMCHRIPRIRSMRRWTNAQNVPPIGGAGDADTHLRHDTNQPANDAQRYSNALIPFSNQEDSVPQPIRWVPWVSQQLHPLRVTERPHPVLCHPSLGPIDVMPDHPHEGWCFEDDEIDLKAKYAFGEVAGDEYPRVGGVQPQPHVIAHGTTVPNPPYNLAKGASPQKRFGMVSVYDGHPANVGRVATDSTWHHWFDENIFAIEAAGGKNWDKISRYYLNVATWLAPPGVHDHCFVYESVLAHLGHLGLQEYHPKASVWDLGLSLRTQLSRIYGPCWVTHWVFERLRIVDDDMWAWLQERLFWRHGIPTPGGDPCLSCPPFEMLELALLGGLVRAGFPLAQDLRDQLAKGPEAGIKIDTRSLMKKQLDGIGAGAKEFRSAMTRSLKEVQVLGTKRR